MHAIILGASGATGRDVLHLLLQDNSIQRVDIFVRHALDITHEKLHMHCIDFEKQDTWQHLVKGDVLFSCLGTTRKAAKTKEAQWNVDYTYQYRFATCAADNKVETLVLVSSIFASTSSRIFYTKMKGQLDAEVKKLDFKKLIIFKPPSLIRKNSSRIAEKISIACIQILNYFGMLHKQKPLPTHILAKAMIETAIKLPNGEYTIEAKEIWNYAKLF